jgi:hypothetical protein
MSNQRGRGFAHTLTRKCWVKKGKALSLRRRLARSEAERNKKWVFDAGINQIQISPSVVKC